MNWKALLNPGATPETLGEGCHTALLSRMAVVTDKNSQDEYILLTFTINNETAQKRVYTSSANACAYLGRALSELGIDVKGLEDSPAITFDGGVPCKVVIEHHGNFVRVSEFTKNTDKGGKGADKPKDKAKATNTATTEGASGKLKPGKPKPGKPKPGKPKAFDGVVYEGATYDLVKQDGEDKVTIRDAGGEEYELSKEDGDTWELCHLDPIPF